jgi:hypothetical protein
MILDIQKELKGVEFYAEIIDGKSIIVTLERKQGLIKVPFPFTKEEFWETINFGGKTFDIRVEFDEVWCVGIYGLKEFGEETFVDMENYIQVSGIKEECGIITCKERTEIIQEISINELNKD